MQTEYIPYEKQYLNNLRSIMAKGVPCDAERTGTGTRMLTGLGYQVDLRKEFPILSTKKMNLEKIFHENMWFISGSTSNDDLLATGTKIWTGWEDDCGQLGPLYGAMWRRRPATNIRYEETAPLPGYYEHKKITKNFVRTKCKKTPNLTGIVCTNVRTRTALIHSLWYDMMSRAAEEGATVEDNWLTVEGFTKDFPRIAGNELLHLAIDKSDHIKAKKLVVVNYQTGHNAYNIDVACIVPEYLAKEYPRQEVTNESGGNTFLCPVFYIDQVAEALDQLRDHSQSRRIVIDCWDPSLTPIDGLRPSLQPMLGLQSLAPCHPLFQFNVVPSANGEPARLDLCVYMRSQDKFLGTPFNMAGYAMICHMFASVTDLQPGVLTMTGGNCHIYSDHVSQVKTQLRRKLRPMVTLAPVPKRHNLEDFKLEDFQLTNYKPAKAIKGAVAI